MIMLKIDKISSTSRLLSGDLFDLQYNLEKILDFRTKQYRSICDFWNIDESMDKNSLFKKKDSDYIEISTSGSTAKPFRYRVWRPAYNRIEIDLHYLYILREYGINNKNLSILKVSPYRGQDFNPIVWKSKKFYFRQFKPKQENYWYSHGSKNASCSHFLYKIEDVREFCEFLIEFCSNSKFDVFLSSFSFISILISVFSKSYKLFNLISNTCESVVESELSDVYKICDNFCDHMRCWDGGMTFMTCRYGVRHILDYLSYVEEIDSKLISSDFFNLSMSFVNYWNGDLGSIENEWKKCLCGRYYRNFKLSGCKKSFWFGDQRVMSSIDLYDVVSKMNCMSQAICFDDRVEIITTSKLDNKNKEYLIKNIPCRIEFKINEFRTVGRFDKILRVIKHDG